MEVINVNVVSGIRKGQYKSSISEAVVSETFQRNIKNKTEEEEKLYCRRKRKEVGVGDGEMPDNATSFTDTSEKHPHLDLSDSKCQKNSKTTKNCICKRKGTSHARETYPSPPCFQTSFFFIFFKKKNPLTSILLALPTTPNFQHNGTLSLVVVRTEIVPPAPAHAKETHFAPLTFSFNFFLNFPN